MEEIKGRMDVDPEDVDDAGEGDAEDEDDDAADIVEEDAKKCGRDKKRLLTHACALASLHIPIDNSSDIN